MTGTDLLGAGGREPDGPGPEGLAEEAELRILLHEAVQAVPDLDAPEDRLDRILARAARTRRRRLAAGLGTGLTAGLVAAALAAAPALAPAPEHSPLALPPTTPVPTELSPQALAPTTPGATGASPSASPAAPSPSVAGGATGTPIRFKAFWDAVVDVPPDWRTRGAATGDLVGDIGYLTNLPLDGGPACPSSASLCPSMAPTPVDSAILTLRFADPRLTEKLSAAPAPLAEAPLAKDCAARGGDRELVGIRTVYQKGKPVLIELSACLRKPSERTLQVAQQVLDSIRSAESADHAPTGVDG
ncbi:hypothetical protein [Kitasatospora sp. NPDC097643]|uniref:hypothetical protein n=1 Tax=Kitasatospora sp. NPDC097643 TaxID=3157230 RepID=UPI003316E296